jgi:hypothetical protein
MTWVVIFLSSECRLGISDDAGKVPGSMSINSTSIFEDRHRIPIMKLFS